MLNIAHSIPATMLDGYSLSAAPACLGCHWEWSWTWSSKFSSRQKQFLEPTEGCGCYMSIGLLSCWESVCILWAKVTRGLNFKMSCQIYVNKCLTYSKRIVCIRCPSPVQVLFDFPKCLTTLLIVCLNMSLFPLGWSLLWQNWMFDNNTAKAHNSCSHITPATCLQSAFLVWFACMIVSESHGLKVWTSVKQYSDAGSWAVSDSLMRVFTSWIA